MVDMNKALLGKWLRRFAIDKDVLWRKVVGWKFGCVDGDWRSMEVRGTYGVGVWKAISTEWEEFAKQIRFIVGDGGSVRFWLDLWCGDRPLCEEFPNLYTLATNAEAWVTECLRWNMDVFGWDVSFGRNFIDWEIEDVVRFFEKIYAAQVVREEPDRVEWSTGRQGKFSVRSYYHALVGTNGSSLAVASIWVPRVPSKVSFFTWVACWGKCLTLDNLKKRGFVLANCSSIA